MNYRKLIPLLAGICAISCFAAPTASQTANQHLLLQKQPGFFRFSYDDIKMPLSIQRMGLLGLNYFADFTPSIYGGIGGYGAVTGSQGGLFTLGIGGGLHHELFHHVWGDVGLYVGGGGGRASLVGGGLMLRPQAGLEYDFQWIRVGAHYSYVDFPSGKIRSQQVGVDLDIPYDFYYVPYRDVGPALFKLNEINLFNGQIFGFQRNDFGILLQTYRQSSGTRNVSGQIQDGAMGLVGAELDHYITDNGFWYLKAGGAFSGQTNGYMDVLGGLGYHKTIYSYGFAFVPQLGIGAGGGGNVDTGGGILIQPQLGFEWPFTRSFSGRLSGGYLWAPQGQLKAATVTAEILYHLDLATAATHAATHCYYETQGWRLQLFNQTYAHPQHVTEHTRSPDNLIAIQIDQLFTPHFFFSYQAASAYSGVHAGGYATGMIGPGVQTSAFLNHHLQLFGEILVGAGGGGDLALGGGALIEPVAGLHYALSDAWGLQASIADVKALHNQLNTPVLNIGITLRFGTLNGK